MSFAWPLALIFLLLVPWLFSLAWWHYGRSLEATLALIAEPASTKMAVRWGEPHMRWRMVLLGVLTALLVIASAGPGQRVQPANPFQPPGSIMFVLDLSRSMTVRDCQGVSRAEAAQAFIEARLAQLDGWRVGLTGFAGEAQVLVPLTSDFAAVRTLLGQSRPGLVMGSGSQVEAGLKESVKWLPADGERVVVLLSDGEEQGGAVRTALRQLTAKGVHLIVVGLGTPDGGTIPVRAPSWGQAAYLTYRGETVISRREETALKDWAYACGGRYVPAESEAIARAAFAALPSSNPSVPQPEDTHESSTAAVFQWIILMAIALLAVEQMLESGVVESALAWRAHPVLRSLLVISLALTPSLFLKGWSWPHWMLNREALDAARKGNFAQAEAHLRLALRERPADAVLWYNLGSVQYGAGQFALAKVSFQAALDRAPDRLAPHVRYNLGNACFRLGEKGIRGAYQEAITAYEGTLKQTPGDREAKDNLELARQRLQSERQTQPPSESPSPSTPKRHESTRERAANLPGQAEVDALLDALEHEERQQTRAQSDTDDPSWSDTQPLWDDHFVADQKNW